MEIRGTIKLNNCPIQSEITSISAYIQQEDLFVGSLTVKEHLTFQVCEWNRPISIPLNVNVYDFIALVSKSDLYEYLLGA